MAPILTGIMQSSFLVPLGEGPASAIFETLSGEGRTQMKMAMEFPLGTPECLYWLQKACENGCEACYPSFIDELYAQGKGAEAEGYLGEMLGRGDIDMYRRIIIREKIDFSLHELEMHVDDSDAHPIFRKESAAGCIQKIWRQYHLERDLKARSFARNFSSIHEHSVIPSELKRSWLTYSSNSTRLYMLLSALKIKELYQKTHYTFTHAHSRAFLGIFHLITQIAREVAPEKNLSQFTLLFRRLGSNKYKNSTEFIEDRAFVHDHDCSDDLISVDGYLLNETGNESALSFLSRGEGVVADYFKILDEIICSLGLPPEINRIIFDKIIAVCPMSRAHRTGILQVVSIPKGLVENALSNPVYRSHEFGKICECSDFSIDARDEGDALKILNTAQRNIKPLSATHDERGLSLQWRLLSNVGELPGVRVNTIKPDDDLDGFIFSLNLIIEELFIYKELYANSPSIVDKKALQRRITSFEKTGAVLSKEALKSIVEKTKV